MDAKLSEPGEEMRSEQKEQKPSQGGHVSEDEVLCYRQMGGETVPPCTKSLFLLGWF